MRKNGLKLMSILLIVLIRWTPVAAQSDTVLSNGMHILEEDTSYYLVTDFDTCLIKPDKIMIKFITETLKDDIESIEQDYTLSNRKSLMTNWVVYSLPANINFISTLQSLLAEQVIDKIQINFEFSYCSLPPGIPNDPFYNEGKLYYITKLDLENAWEIETGDPQVIVADFDNGFDWNVSDFGPDNNLGYNFQDNNNWTYPHNGYNSYHGTEVGGLIIAKTNNNSESCGVAGGWGLQGGNGGVKLMELVTGYPDAANYIYCVEALDYGLEHNVRIFNFPFGEYISQPLPECVQGFKEQIDLAYEMGAIMFSTTGNQCPIPNPNGEPIPLEYLIIQWPANDEHVIAVGATDENDAQWYAGAHKGSAYGPEIELSAPGVNLYMYNPSLPPFNGWGLNDGGGTSFSSGLAAGIAALLISSNPCLSNSDVEYILKQTADKPHYGYDWSYDYNWNQDKPGHCLKLGYGRINAYNALIMASSQQKQITGTETWTEPKWYTQDLVIASGATLTIQSIVKFSAGTKIIVEKGGHLIIDGGTLTTDCSDYWEGIELESDHTLSQTPRSNQGYLTLLNNAIIDKARFGVKNYFPDPSDNGTPFPSSYGGGIIDAENAIFRNCGVSVSFGLYPGFQSVSKFENCSFIWDDRFLINNNPTCFVNMSGVDNIKFYQCIFDNHESAVLPGNGIQAYNSTFYVDGICSTQQSPCPKEFYYPSVFNNLRYGIYALTTGTTDYFIVQHSQFADNLKGIYASNVNFATVTSNSFDVKSLSESYGLYFENSTGYHIEDNTFTGDQDQSTEEVGLYIRNSGY